MDHEFGHGVLTSPSFPRTVGRTPLDSRLKDATCDDTSDPILTPHDAWHKKPKPVSNPWHYTRYSFPLMRSVYAS